MPGWALNLKREREKREREREREKEKEREREREREKRKRVMFNMKRHVDNDNGTVQTKLTISLEGPQTMG